MYLRLSRPRFDSMERKLEGIFPEITSAFSYTDIPPIDVADHGDGYEIIAELPGLKKEDLKIIVENGLLELTGERKNPKFPQGTKVVRRETSSGSFSRILELPDDAETQAITAELTDGVLRIRIQKTEKSLPHQITIK